jgi:hypothetical protein
LLSHCGISVHQPAMLGPLVAPAPLLVPLAPPPPLAPKSLTAAALPRSPGLSAWALACSAWAMRLSGGDRSMRCAACKQVSTGTSEQ